MPWTMRSKRSWTGCLLNGLFINHSSFQPSKEVHKVFQMLSVCRLSKVLDWECAARTEIDRMAEYIKSLQKMLLLADGERDQLLQENKEISNSHSKDLSQLTKTRARTRWATARKQTQVDEKFKKMKVLDYSLAVKSLKIFMCEPYWRISHILPWLMMVLSEEAMLKFNCLPYMLWCWA